ncbi:MAG: hypothetical protein RIQ89_1207 [Bacteroidota bacterium]|jgi:undecaprenyl diphosphate synthase
MATVSHKIDPSNIPSHVAIIMDGNGRWAKRKGWMRLNGHQHAVKAVRETTEAAAALGIKFLTLYAFSTENWNRPKEEVAGLMELLVGTIVKETPTLMKNKIKLQMIGDVTSLPPKAAAALQQAIDDTSHNSHMTLVLALSYSSRWEITQAVKAIADKVKKQEISVSEISEGTISNHLQASFMPDPELLIRTSGEYRISNYLLWQLAYAELYFTDVLWPDFRKEDLHKAVENYQQRERRFGMTSEQINKS